jgi:hypothetical protein
MQGHWVNARPGDEPRDSGQTEAAGKITECDRKLTQYRAALDEGCNAKTIGAWIAETEAEKARYEIGLRQVAKARERMTEQEIRSIVDKLADIARVLADADADDKSEILVGGRLQRKQPPAFMAGCAWFSARPGLASAGSMRRAALGAGPALALVHGLYAGDRDGVALRDEVFRQRLRRRQGSGPGIGVGQQPRRVPHREVPRRYLVQRIPGHRE